MNQEIECFRVAPMPVFEPEHERLGNAGTLEEVADRLLQPPAILVWITRGARQDAGAVAQLGDQASQLPSLRAQIIGRGDGVAFENVRAERLHKREVPEGQRSWLVAVPDENPSATSLNVRRKVLGNRGLADSRL